MDAHLLYQALSTRFLCPVCEQNGNRQEIMLIYTNKLVRCPICGAHFEQLEPQIRVIAKGTMEDVDFI